MYASTNISSALMHLVGCLASEHHLIIHHHSRAKLCSCTSERLQRSMIASQQKVEINHHSCECNGDMGTTIIQPLVMKVGDRQQG
jgi:hypothetical protein